MLYRVSGRLIADFCDEEVEADDAEDAKRQLEANACGEWEDFEIEPLSEQD